MSDDLRLIHSSVQMNTDLLQMIAADISCRRWMCDITYFKVFVGNPLVFPSVAMLFLACGSNVATTLRAFRAECYT